MFTYDVYTSYIYIYNEGGLRIICLLTSQTLFTCHVLVISQSLFIGEFGRKRGKALYHITPLTQKHTHTPPDTAISRTTVDARF